MPSFDVVSRVNMQEVDNAVNQVKKEIGHRYDFRNSKSTIELDDTSITILADDNMKLSAMRDILSEKMAKRGVGLRSLDFAEPEAASLGFVRQKITIKQGISTDDGKKIVKLIKDANVKKVQAQIQQDQVRVTGQKRDDLQAVIRMLKESVELELQFVNFKD